MVTIKERETMQNLTHKITQKITPQRIGYWLGLAAIAWLTVIPPVQANIQFVPKPPDQGSPNGRQRGGASRGDCLTYQGLSALVPQIEGVVWSQTISATPHFFFSIPAALTEASPIEFVLQDSNDDYAFRKQFTMDASAGTLAIPVAGLTPGESYAWTFSIYCDAARPSASVFVSGTIQYLPSASVEEADSELTPAEQFDRVKQYAAKGIWHETLDLAIALHQADPNNPDYVEVLTTLLAQAGLADISLTAPIHTAP